MAKILITGGTGLVGNALTKYFISKNHEIIILTRSPQKYNATENITYAKWDTEKQIIDENTFANADFIVHLAGAGVMDKRWNEAYKNEILQSRVNSGKLISDYILNKPNKIQAIVTASATGWYGPDKDNSKPFIEFDTYNNDFLGTTCYEWEQSTKIVESKIKRIVLRIGIVLDSKGGALAEFEKPLKFGLASVLGNGKQMVSWIHINDLCRLIDFSLFETQKSDIFNAVSSNPVSNKILTKTLANIKNGKWFLTSYVPAFVLKIVLGSSSIEILKSCTVNNEKVKAFSFNFLHDDIENALKNIYN